MRLALRIIQRLIVVGLGVLAVWLIAFVIFPFTNDRTSWVLALILTYGISAYFLLPIIVRTGIRLVQPKRTPHYTLSTDGLPADPVNLVLIGTLRQLRQAFAQAGWVEAERLSPRSALRMVKAFVLRQSYPDAPFSSLYLFGRGQDIGFQKAIGNDPRRRHHVRFWSKNLEQANLTVGTAAFWHKADRPDTDRDVAWVGAGTKDTGLAFTQLTFQFTHATDDHSDTERNLIMSSLLANGSITKPNSLKAAANGPEIVNHYLTDGRVAVAQLK